MFIHLATRCASILPPVVVCAALSGGCAGREAPEDELSASAQSADTSNAGGDPGPGAVGLDARTGAFEGIDDRRFGSPTNTLAVAASRTGRKMGSSADYPQIVSETPYIDTLSREFDYVTSGNTMKWGVVQPIDADHWDFTQADAIVAFAEAHHQAIKGHTLVWHEQLPPFVDDTTPPQRLRQLLRKNIHVEVGRYRGRLYAWDVVNEAVADDGSGLRDTVFSEKLGSDYVAWAFREAHRVDPHAKLFYNDYGTETVNAKSTAVYQLMAKLVAAGTPIDGVGFQMHLEAATAPSTEDIVTNLQRFAALGLSVNISELDVRIASLTASEPEKLAIEKQVYHRVVAACLQVPRCRAVTTWGFTDKYTWIDSAFGPDEPLEFDTQYQKKAAYYGIIDGFAGIAPDAVGTAPNLIPNATFEAGLDGWSASGGVLAETRSQSHTGFRGALVANRKATTDGAAFDVTKLVVSGHGYDVSAWALARSGRSDQVSLGVTMSCAGAADVVAILGTATSTKSSWTELTGSLQVPTCVLGNVSIYVSGPRPGVDLFLDDVALRPQPEPRGPNAVSNPGFETGDTSGWVTWSGTIAATNLVAHSGTYSGVVSQRTATWQGPVSPLLSAVTPGATYAASAWVRIDGASSDAVDLSVKTTCSGGDPVYQQIASSTATNTGWVQLTGTVAAPVCALAEFDMYVEGPQPGVNVLVDDVALEQLLWHPVATSVVGNSDFESGGAGWAAFGGAFSVSSAFAHGGTQSGEDSDRTATWNGPSYGLPNSPATYNVSAWALQDGADDLPLLLSAKLVCGASTNYPTLATATATPDIWVQLQGALVVPAGCTSVVLYLQQASGVAFPNLYVDDVSAVFVPSTNRIANSDFESGSAGWAAFGGTLGISSTIAHGGSQSAVDTGRTAAWNGPSYALPTTVASYSVSAWVYQDGAASVPLLLTTKLVCGDATTYPTVAGPATVAPNTWAELIGSLAVPSGCTTALLYLNQADGNVFPDLFIDDVSVVQ
jgi:endo-1,4-beta-xylanase